MMQVGIRRSVSSLPVLVGCSIFVLISASSGRSDPPDGGERPGDPGLATGTQADDSLADPFVLLLPSDWQQVTTDPQAYARWALTEQAGESRLEPFTTPSGIHVLRIPGAPAVDPDPDVVGLYHRQATEPLLRFLRALSEEQRRLLAAGEVVNITGARDVVAEVMSARRTVDRTGGLDKDTLESCELLAAALAVVPAVQLRGGQGDGGGRSDVDISYSREPGRVKDLQVKADGLTFWSALAARDERHEGEAGTWRVLPWHLQGTSRDITSKALPGLLQRLGSAEAYVSLSDVNGAGLQRIVEELGNVTWYLMGATDKCASWVVYARGDDVTTRAFVEALFASRRLAIRARKPDGMPVVADGSSQVWAASGELAELARRRPDPALTAELRSLLAPALERPYLSEAPIPLSRFAEGYEGPVSGLAREDAEWVQGIAREVITTYQRIPAFDLAWLNEDQALWVRLRLEFHVTIAACVPYRKADSATHEYVAAYPPPSYYTVLGASGDYPILSTITELLRGY